MKEKIKLFLEKLREMPDSDRVKFVFLFGSHAEDKQNKLSDIDFAIYYEGSRKERFKFRLKMLSKLSDKFDIQIFQDLPLIIRKDILKGKLIYVKDITFAYDVAYQTIKDYERFKKYCYDYIKMRRVI